MSDTCSLDLIWNIFGADLTWTNSEYLWSDELFDFIWDRADFAWNESEYTWNFCVPVPPQPSVPVISISSGALPYVQPVYPYQVDDRINKQKEYDIDKLITLILKLKGDTIVQSKKKNKKIKISCNDIEVAALREIQKSIKISVLN